MQLTRLLFLLFCLLVSQKNIFAQKWQTQVAVGTFYIPGSNSLNELGKPNNVFGGFSPGWQVGAGLLYKLKSAFQAGPFVGFGGASKTNYQLKNLQAGLKLCYSPFYTWEKMQPYVFAFPFYSFAYISRDSYESRIDNSGFPTGNEPDAYVRSVDYAYTKQQTGGANFGIMPGFGIKGKLKGDFEYFANIGYSVSNLASNADIKEKYPESKGAFGNISLLLGIGFNFGKKEKKKELILASDTASILDTIGYLKKENFDFTKQFNLTGKIENSKLIVYATTFISIKNINGNEIARSKVDTTGSFRFENLHPDDYLIVKSVVGMQVKANYIVSQSDNQLFITQSQFQNGALKGYLLEKNSKKPLANFKFMLVENVNRQVFEGITDNEGRFVFNKLPYSDFSLAVGDANKPINSKLYALSDDSVKMITINDFKQYNFKKITSELESTAVAKAIIVGNIFPIPSDIMDLILVNSIGQVISNTATDKDGYFVFSQVDESDYSVISEYTKLDHKTRAKLLSSNSIITAEDFRKYDFKKLSQDEDFVKKGGIMLIGKVLSDTSKNSHLYLLNGNGKLVGNVIVGKDGYFIFRNLLPDDYSIVSEIVDTNLIVHAKLMLAVPELMVKGNEMYKYNYKTLKNEHLQLFDKFMLLGSIGSITGLPQDNDLIMFLLDAEGNVVRQTLVDRNGNFSFSHLPVGNYQIVPDQDIPNFKPRLEMYEDKSTLIEGETEYKSTFIKSSYYGPNEYKLNVTQTKYLDVIIAGLLSNKSIKKINLHGYGDMTGTYEYNLELTKKRTEEVRKYLISKGVNSEIIQLNPMGRSMKYKNTQDVYDPTLNRRVDIEVLE